MLACMFALGGVLQDDTGAQIDINSTTGDVRVKGPEEAVKAAVAAITVLCGLDKAKAQVPYDERAIAGFLGKAGANVTALADEYKVTLTLNRGKKCVVIRGEAADVEAAKAVVAKRLKELVRVEETINFPVARLPYLMGAKGSRIRQLQVLLASCCFCIAFLVLLHGSHAFDSYSPKYASLLYLLPNFIHSVYVYVYVCVRLVL